MKKTMTIFLSSAIILSITAPVMAANTNLISIQSPQVLIAPIAPISEAKNTVIVNGENLDVNSHKPFQKGDIVMIPLRLTAEKLGFTVTWDNETQTVNLDNGIIKTTLQVGEDSYYKCSSSAIGLTRPTGLGEAPTIVGETTFVPLSFYNLMFSNDNAATVKNGVISINNKSTDKIDALSPLRQYSSIENAQKAIGIKFQVPTDLPSEYGQIEINVISNYIAQISYGKKTETITYRVAKTDSEISGDYNVYSQTAKFIINNMNVNLKGNNELINLAVWSDGENSYSLGFSEAVTKEQVISIIKNIK